MVQKVPTTISSIDDLNMDGARTPMSVPSASPMHMPAESVSVAPPQPGLNVSQQVASSDTDDDIDALDGEWIAKAKTIVEHTKEDPYTESIELSKAKADYLRIRYNKLIKINNSHQG